MVAEVSARHVVAIAAVAGALVGGLVGGVVAAVSGSGTDSGAGSLSPGGGSVTTAAVVRTTLTTTVQVGGSIGYDGSYTVTALRGSGEVYTWLPEPGAVIRQDQPLYSAGNEPVPLLYGAVPAYRAFGAGMSGGADVGELTRDLITLGFGGGLTPGDRYTSATAAAVGRWQGAVGLPVTGEIPLGEVVFEPGPIRVTSVAPWAGAPVGGAGSAVLTATSTTPIVVVDLGVSEEYLVKPGDAVSVVLPDGTSTVGGRIETVGNVATCPGGGGIGTGGGASGSADQSPCSSGGGNATPTVTVTIALDSTPPGATLDQAPVNVNVTTQQVRNVLAVPVNALLALAGGGFGVEVVTGTATRLVGVTTGVYSNTLVQVSGSGITVGTRVEVPSS